MARLIPCPACERHVRASEGACPFCGHASLTTTAPGRLSIALLSLGLAACLTNCTKATPEAKPDPAKAVEEPEVTPTPAPAAPDTSGGAVTPEPAAAETGETTGAEHTSGADDSQGTDDGASINDDPPPEIKEPAMTKYGGPRPQPQPRPHKKYGAPPPPHNDPLGGF